MITAMVSMMLMAPVQDDYGTRRVECYHIHGKLSDRTIDTYKYLDSQDVMFFKRMGWDLVTVAKQLCDDEIREQLENDS